MITRKRQTLFISASLIVFGLLAGGYFVFTRAQMDSDAPNPASVLKQLQKCGKEDDMIDCSRHPVQEFLQLKSAGEVMRVLSDTLSPVQCHRIGHLVGQEVYRKYKNVEMALGECSYTCFSACVHGAIGEAFVEEAGVNAAVDLEHLNPEEIRSLGKRLCASRDSCHGVGHALFQQYSDINPSLEICRNIATGTARKSCFAGVFMEYEQELISVSMWESPPNLIYLSQESLVSFCSRSSDDEADACFGYFTPIVVDTLVRLGVATSTRDAYTQVPKICESYASEKTRQYCIFGYGASSYQLIFTALERAAHICQDFSRDSDEWSCVSGMVSRAAEYDNLDKVLSFCALFPEDISTKCSESASAIHGGEESVQETSAE